MRVIGAVNVPPAGEADALETIRLVGGRSHRFVIDGDIQKSFDTLDHGKLMELLRRRISGRKVLKLLGQWLKAKVFEAGRCAKPNWGVPREA